MYLYGAYRYIDIPLCVVNSQELKVILWERNSSDKIDKNSAVWGKFCLKIFRRIFCPTCEMICKAKIGRNWSKFEMVMKILSDEFLSSEFFPYNVSDPGYGVVHIFPFLRRSLVYLLNEPLLVLLSLPYQLVQNFCLSRYFCYWAMCNDDFVFKCGVAVRYFIASVFFC